MSGFPLRLACLYAAMLAGGAGSAVAQADASGGKLDVSGSVRVRYEWIDGQPRSGFNPSDDLLNVRTRLAATYTDGATTVVGEVFDSRAWLADAGTPVSTNEVNSLELVQAYVAHSWSEPFGGKSKASMQAGRFMLNLGSRRFVAADDFRNTTNGYTGLRADAAGEGWSTTGIYVLPQIRLPMDAQGLKDNAAEFDRETGSLRLWGGLASVDVRPSGGALQASYFRLDEEDQPDLPSRNRHLDTYALRFFREPAPDVVDYDAEVAVQTGDVRTGNAPTAPVQDVWAGYAHLEAGRTWRAPYKLRVALEYDWASGDEPGGDYNRFDTLFGMRRAEIAPAGLYNAVGRANLSAPGVRLEVEPDLRWDAFASFRQLFLASRTDSFSTTGVRDQDGLTGTFAGSQIDARVRYWIVPQALRLEANVVHLLKGRFLRKAAGHNDPDDATYVAFDLTASF
jgi:hypothetical protein